MRVLAPGFAADPEKLGLAVLYGRITFPYLLALSLAALCGGVLNALYRYAAAAAAPIMLNVVLILALAVAAPRLGDPGAVLAWAVFGAGVLQFVWLVWACGRAGMILRLRRPRLSPAVRRLLLLMLPAAGSAGVIHINLLIGNIIASHQPGAVSYLYYADRLYQLPLGVIGIAVGVVLLPELARRLRGGDTAAAHTVHNQAVAFAMLLTLPAAGALIVLAGPLVTLLFERGAFGVGAARATAAAVVGFSSGLPAYVLVKVLAPGFFAREDTTTPLVCAAAGVAVNVALSLILFGAIGHVGIALATAGAAWVQAVMLGTMLIRRGLLTVEPTLTRRLSGLVAATLGMMVALRAGLWLVQGALHGPLAARAAAAGCLVIGGAAVYFALVFVFRAADPAVVRAALRRGRGA
jgi:putative peptidoglycan lipid II flippase